MFVPEAMLLEGATFGRALARSRALARNRVGFCLGVWLATVLLPAFGAMSMDLLGNALVGFVLQLGYPTGELFERRRLGLRRARRACSRCRSPPRCASSATSICARARKAGTSSCGSSRSPSRAPSGEGARRDARLAALALALATARGTAVGGDRDGRRRRRPGGASRDARAPADGQLPAQERPPLVKEVFARDVWFCHESEVPADARRAEVVRAAAQGRRALPGAGPRVQPRRDRRAGRPARPPPGSGRVALGAGGAAAHSRHPLDHARRSSSRSWSTRSASRHWRNARPTRTKPVEIATAAPEDPAAAIARQMETDVQRLLERARAAAAAGDYVAADRRCVRGAAAQAGGRAASSPSNRTARTATTCATSGRQAPALRPRMQAVVAQRRGGPVRRRRADREPLPLRLVRRDGPAGRAARRPGCRSP